MGSLGSFGLFAATQVTWILEPSQRIALAAATAAALCLLLGAAMLPWLRQHGAERVVNRLDALYALQRHKQGTPTLGGLFVTAAIGVSALLWCAHGDPAVACALAIMAGLAAVGLADDAVKLRGLASGLSPLRKLLFQTLVVGPAVAWWALAAEAQGPCLTLVPGYGPVAPPLPTLVGLGVLCVLGSANAVNLTDGLDGLAAGCSVCTLLGLLAAMTGAFTWLGTGGAPVEIAWEPAVLTAIAAGAAAAFLLFNRHPARVFMGNTGALALGGLIGALALTTGYALWLVPLGGVFVVETLSVVVQRTGRRLLGVRVLHCAPLHHHLQLSGWHERRAVRWLWGAAAACAVGTLLCLPTPGGTNRNVQRQQQAERTAPDAPWLR